MLFSLFRLSFIILVTAHVLQHRADRIQLPSLSSDGLSRTQSSVLNANLSSLAQSTSTSPSLNYTANLLGLPRPECREPTPNMRASSCTEVLRLMEEYINSISEDKSKLSVGTRGRGFWDIPSPLKFVSRKSRQASLLYCVKEHLLEIAYFSAFLFHLIHS